MQRYSWCPAATAQKAATAYVENSDGCWISTLSKNNDGYAFIVWSDVDGRSRTMSAARAAWSHHFGHPHPELTIDHRLDICKSRACVRPNHLRLLAGPENTARARRFIDWEPGRCERGHYMDTAPCSSCVGEIKDLRSVGMTYEWISRWTGYSWNKTFRLAHSEPCERVAPNYVFDDIPEEDLPEIPVDLSDYSGVHFVSCGSTLQMKGR